MIPNFQYPTGKSDHEHLLRSIVNGFYSVQSIFEKYQCVGPNDWQRRDGSGERNLADVVAVNEKGIDVTKEIDRLAESTLIGYLKDQKVAANLLSEEQSGVVSIAPAQPTYACVIDPLDGSTNCMRGREGFGICVTAYEYADAIDLLSPIACFIGSLSTGNYMVAEQRKGVFYFGPKYPQQGVQAKGSSVKKLAKASYEIDLDFDWNERRSGEFNAEETIKVARILPLLFPRAINQIRRDGAASLGMMGVPIGTADGYIDVRGKSTPENFVGFQYAVKLVGGAFTDIDGNELPRITVPVTSGTTKEHLKPFFTPYDYIASGNKELHQQLVDVLRDRDIWEKHCREIAAEIGEHRKEK